MCISATPSSFFHQTVSANGTSRRQCEFDRFHATPVRSALKFLGHITSDENALGSGGFGDVHKAMGLTDHQGVLEKGTAIAVKMLRIAEAQLGDDEVLKEVTKLFSLQHRTVAQLRLRGKSVWAETRERLLCFECVPSRSLREHFLWPLLGGKNEHPNITRSSARTLGYMAAPEYLNEEEISKKADTFSFGVLILEVVTGFRVDHHQSKKELWAQFTKDDPCSLLIGALHPWLPVVRARGSGDADVRMAAASASRSCTWCARTTPLKIMVSVFLMILLLNPSSSWSWVVRVLKVALVVVGSMAAHLVRCLQSFRCSCPRGTIWKAVEAALAAVLVQLSPSSLWPFLTLYCLEYFRDLWAWVILVFGLGVLAALLLMLLKRK